MRKFGEVLAIYLLVWAHMPCTECMRVGCGLCCFGGGGRGGRHASTALVLHHTVGQHDAYRSLSGAGALAERGEGGRET